MSDGAAIDHAAATNHIAEANHAVRMDLALEDTEDFEDARTRLRRGALARARERHRAGAWYGIWSPTRSSTEECPDTVNPSLWRQSQLNAIHGLFEVVPGIYQVRGLDLSNMTIVEGREGVLVIDPLICAETAAAALALYREHRGERPVTGLLYTHSHVDHFGGALGVLDAARRRRGTDPGAGPGGLSRARDQRERVRGHRDGAPRGIHVRHGTRARPPRAGGHRSGHDRLDRLDRDRAPHARDRAAPATRRPIDGIAMIFQMTPGSEAPAEMNFLFPDHRALCIAENATHNLHNVITPRGALVRDARVWSRYLGEAIDLFGERADALFAGHQWPRWGRERIVEMLAQQRDLYGYLHDQTLRLLNKGYVGSEIAELLELPAGLAREWHCREYYGTVSHNVKGIYQRYMGWFDGNPAHLWPHPPEQAATRYVRAMGGAEAVLQEGQQRVRGGRLPLGGGADVPRGVRRPLQPPGPRASRPGRSSSSPTAPRARRGATSS